MKRQAHIILTAIMIVASPLFASMACAVETDDELLEELVVTAERRAQPALRHAGNVALLTSEEITDVAHQHIYDIMTRVPGTWLSRGSGQEHLTAIRSPVLTGPGSCGAFLTLEDGIPSRPAGFCNVNQMFELFTEQADSIEVIRGPGNALYGANALHGTINVLMPRPSDQAGASLAIEAGANDFLRVRGTLDGGEARPMLLTALYADDGGFRDDAGYRQAKLHGNLRQSLAGGELTLGFTATELDQETAGFIIGEDAYRDPDVNRSNPNPEAFRDASSQRIYGSWQKSLARVDVDLRPYLRHSDMRFLQHFLPGQPLEENRHVSAGALLSLTIPGERRRIMTGLDFEVSDQSLLETQPGPAEGSDFLRETRPEGKHYDFDVRSAGIAAWLHSEFELSPDLTLNAGLRVEYLHYAYDNRMLSGNTRDDGTPCGFGGCLYTRPQDRSDAYLDVAPKLAISYRLSETAALFASLARGFRPPQATELYRLQSGQQVADLDSENVDSLEAGLRWQRPRFGGEIAAFAMRKRDSVYRDSEGFNVSGARSRHEGVEWSLQWQFADPLMLDANMSYARHVYDFDTVAARGETFSSGNDIDTAPRLLGSLEIQAELSASTRLALQWTMIGKHYLDAENRFTYPGHEVLNLRAHVDVTRRLRINVRLDNVLDEAIADRADYAFGDYRYLPGDGRALYVELELKRD